MRGKTTLLQLYSMRSFGNDGGQVKGKYESAALGFLHCAING